MDAERSTGKGEGPASAARASAPDVRTQGSNERGSLSAVGVVVTRDEGPDGPLSVALSERGARVLHWGSMGVWPPADPVPFESALDRIDRFDWVCFGSPRAVEAVVGRVREAPEGVRMAVVGPSTAASLREAGWPVHRVPGVAGGKGLVEAFRHAGDASGARILIPGSAIAREELPAGLSDLGAIVEQVTAYRVVALPLDREMCAASVEAGEVDVVTFASPSAFRGLAEGLGEELIARLEQGTPAAAMGATTAAALRDAGWRRVVVAEVPTFFGLAAAAALAANMK